MIYFDNAATTKPSALAIEKASLFNSDLFYNPSALYQAGIDNSNFIKSSKEKILKYLGISSSEYEVIYTSCGTESDNQAIFCSVKRGSFVTTFGEHSAVYKSFLELKNKGQTVAFINLNNDGSVDTKQLFEYVKNNRVDFVSIVHINNETGAINDINYIADNIKKINPKIIFHSDGVQAFGKIKYKLSKNIDFYSISGHKINALKGTGVLIRKKRATLSPYLIGGGQENNLRSGTENIFGIKVLEYALEERFSNLESIVNQAKAIKQKIIEILDRDLFKIIDNDNISPFILSITAVGLRGEVIMHSLEKFDIIVGNGSACSSKNRYSRVLEACGYTNEYLDGVIRLSFSVGNTLEEAEFVAKKLNETAKELKGIMKQ